LKGRYSSVLQDGIICFWLTHYASVITNFTLPCIFLVLSYFEYQLAENIIYSVYSDYWLCDEQNLITVTGPSNSDIFLLLGQIEYSLIGLVVWSLSIGISDLSNSCITVSFQIKTAPHLSCFDSVIYSLYIKWRYENWL
jgi:hypothetical protein